MRSVRPVGSPASIRVAPTTGPASIRTGPASVANRGYGLRVVTVNVCPSTQLTSTVSSRASQSARTSVTSVHRAGAPG